MSVTRRDFLRAATVLAGATALGPVAGRAGVAFGQTTAVRTDIAQRRRLVLINLCGGNDGLNTVVPAAGDRRRAAYESARGPLAIAANTLLPLGSDSIGPLGLHPSLPTMHRLHLANRLAVVQGAGYANNNFSHFVATDIWSAGTPTSTPQSGWVGRHLDVTGVGDGELRAVALGSGLPLVLRGGTNSGAQLLTLPPSFPDRKLAFATAVHAAYAGFENHPASNPLRHTYGRVCGSVQDLVTSTAHLSIVPTALPAFVKSMLEARELLVHDERARLDGFNAVKPLGVEVVTVKLSGFDTHADQLATHERLLKTLDLGIEAFLFGTYDGSALYKNGQAIGALPAYIEQRTLLMTWSEFGRRIGGNLSGTDHGAAQPLLLVGPDPLRRAADVPLLRPGFRTEHPKVFVGETNTPANNLEFTTDLRRVHDSVRSEWLAQPTDAPDVRDRGDQLPGLTALDLFE